MRQRRAHHTAGNSHQIIAQYVQFSLVGLSNAVVDLGVLNLLLFMHPTNNPTILTVDNSVAVALAIINSYLWNTRWTFRTEADGSNRQRMLFIAQALVNIAVNDLVLLGMTSILRPSQGIWYLVGSNVAKLVAMVLASTISFVLLRTAVFHSRRASQARAKRRLRFSETQPDEELPVPAATNEDPPPAR
jgi:putative flippase GtrA